MTGRREGSPRAEIVKVALRLLLPRAEYSKAALRCVKSIILCKSLNVVISSGHHAHYTCKNVRALFSQFSWKSINIEPIKRSAEAMFG